MLTSGDVRSGLDGVLTDLKNVLLNAQDNPSWANGKWVPGDQEWERCFRSVAYEHHEVPEGRPEGLVIAVSSDNPRATQDGVKKYADRIQKAMGTYFAGFAVSLQVLGREEAAA